VTPSVSAPSDTNVSMTLLGCAAGLGWVEIFHFSELGRLYQKYHTFIGTALDSPKVESIELWHSIMFEKQA